MSKQTEAMKLALEALERLDGWIALRHGLGLTPQEKEVVTALREALAEQSAQPHMTTNLHDKMLAAIDAYFSASDAVEEEVAENLLLDVRDAINKHKLAADSITEGLRLDDWPKIGCVNHDCDQCKAQQEPQPPYEFERYVAGSLRAQGVRVERATTLADAMRIAAKICPPANPPSAPTVLVYTTPQPPAQPLTDEQCDAIYTALDEWSREVDAYDFGLPAVAGGGIEKGREIIKTAHGITKGGGV